MGSWTRAHLRHLVRLLGAGRVTVPTVYESIGPDFFAAPAPGYLNLGLWDHRPGTEALAPAAAERLVRTLAAALPTGGDVLDVANGLGAQDLVIAETARPRTLVAVNLTERQLRDGADRLARAGARPVVADATRLPIASSSMDGVISVEAAFHFSSRPAFLREAARVLRPGGILTFSDVTSDRRPVTPAGVLAGVTGLRFWGLRPSSLPPAGRLAAMVREAGFRDVRVELCGHRTIDPFVEFLLARMVSATDAPWVQRTAGRVMARQWAHLRRRGVIDYALVSARLP